MILTALTPTDCHDVHSFCTHTLKVIEVIKDQLIVQTPGAHIIHLYRVISTVDQEAEQVNQLLSDRSVVQILAQSLFARHFNNMAWYECGWLSGVGGRG